MLDGLEVASGASDAEPEQVTDTADVATGGVDLVEDAVLARRLRPQGGVRRPPVNGGMPCVGGDVVVAASEVLHVGTTGGKHPR